MSGYPESLLPGGILNAMPPLDLLRRSPAEPFAKGGDCADDIIPGLSDKFPGWIGEEISLTQFQGYATILTKHKKILSLLSWQFTRQG